MLAFLFTLAAPKPVCLECSSRIPKERIPTSAMPVTTLLTINKAFATVYFNHLHHFAAENCIRGWIPHGAKPWFFSHSYLAFSLHEYKSNYLGMALKIQQLSQARCKQKIATHIQMSRFLPATQYGNEKRMFRGALGILTETHTKPWG